MRHVIATLIALGSFGISTFAESRADTRFDWQAWQSLPVLDAGRRKPLDTLARETLRKFGHRSRFADPVIGEKLGPTALYLMMLFDWQGWDQARDSHAMSGRSEYWGNHQADKWDRARLLRVDSAALREALGLAPGRKYLSPLELSEARIRDPDTGKETPFLFWARQLYRRKQEGFTKFEEQALRLAEKLSSYQAHRMGNKLYVLPVAGSEHEDWISINALVRSDYDEQTDPTGGIREVQAEFQKVRAAYLARSPQAFNRAAAAFLAKARETGPQLGVYPSTTTIRLELAYNRWAPFRAAWAFTLIAFLSLLAGASRRWRTFSAVGWVALGAALVAMLVGFLLRMLISGRAPVTNLYESVVFMAFGTVVFGVVFGILSRKPHLLAAAAAVATIALLLADYCPSVLDPSIRPLMPVLRSNFWLAVHVITIMLSYAAFALALAIGNITLGYYLVGSGRAEAIGIQSRFTYQSLKAGVWLLVVGTILGAMWADYSWGRFWGWDPKEVWALITLLGYLALVHARSAGWVGRRGLAAWSVVCFVLVVMAWYGVNLLGTGLHDYGLGGTGAEYYVFGVVFLQLLYVAAAVARPAGVRPPPAPATPARGPA